MPLSSLMKSHAFPQGHAWDMNHRFVQRIHTIICSLPVSHVGAFSMIRSTVRASQCFRSSLLLYFIMAPKHMRSAAGNSDTPERSREGCPLSICPGKT